MLPPRFVRRLILAPLAILITIAAIALSPLLVLAVMLSPSRSARRRALRLIWFSLTWLVMESAALVACLGLWIISGFGGRLRSEASMDRHYALVRWFLATLFRRALKVFHLKVEIAEPIATPEELSARLTRPVIVLARHAGPGDSFLLVHHLLSLYQRKPRIVMKAALQFDPSLDVVINRLPHAFVFPHKRAHPPRTAPSQAAEAVPPGSAVPAASVPPGSAVPAASVLPGSAGAGPGSGSAVPESGSGSGGLAGSPSGSGGRPSHAARRDQAAVEAAAGDSPGASAVVEEIRRLAAGLGPTGALVIFPEGGNFTPSRWRRGVSQLEQAHRYPEAARARRMENLLPPRSGGAFAAIDSAPTADVIFVAHTGLDDLITVGDVWRALPMEQVIRAQWWRVPAEEVPREREDVVRWLYDWWERIDTWIAENRPVRPEPDQG